MLKMENALNARYVCTKFLILIEVNISLARIIFGHVFTLRLNDKLPLQIWSVIFLG